MAHNRPQEWHVAAAVLRYGTGVSAIVLWQMTGTAAVRIEGRLPAVPFPSEELVPTRGGHHRSSWGGDDGTASAPDGELMAVNGNRCNDALCR